VKKFGFIDILGIKFVTGGYEQAISLLNEGGLMVVPAAPALVTLDTDDEYREALNQADFAIPDSGYMLLVLRLFRGINLSKLSGLEFLNRFLFDPNLDLENNLFCVNPSEAEDRINRGYLRTSGIKIDESNSYIAPFYNGDYCDRELLKILELKRPKYIVINLGGGVQEKLGLNIKKNLSFKPAIICTGAAIAFLTGQQALIPAVIDKFYLGWLARCVFDFRRFVPRYLSAFKLINKLLKEDIRREM